MFDCVDSAALSSFFFFFEPGSYKGKGEALIFFHGKPSTKMYCNFSRT